MAFGSFTFAAPAAQKAASGGGAAPPAADVGAGNLTAGMKSVADSIAQAIQYNRIMQGYGAVGSELSAGLGGGASSSAAPATGATNAAPAGNFLLDLQHFESGGRNIPNTTRGTSSGQAQGFDQITTGTWKEFADKAGVDLNAYPTPLSAPKAVQDQLASTIPMKRWAPETLAYLRSKGYSVDPSRTLGDNIIANQRGAAADMPAPNANPAAATGGLPPGAPDFGPGAKAVAGALGQGTPMGAFPPTFQSQAGPTLPVGAPPGAAPPPPPQGPQMGAGAPPAPGGPISPDMTAPAPQPAPRPALPPAPPQPAPQQPPLVGGPMLAQGVGGQAGNFPTLGQGMVSAAMQPPARQPLPTAPPLGAPPAAAGGQPLGVAQGGAAPPAAGGVAPPQGGQGAQPTEGRAASASPDVQAQIQHLVNVINYPDPYGKFTTQKEAAKAQLEKLLNPQLQVVEIGIDKDSGKPIRAEFDPRTGKLTPINAPGSTSSAAAPGSTPAAAQPAAAPAMPKGYDGVFSPDDWNGALSTPKTPQPGNMIGADFSKWQLEQQAAIGKELRANPIVRTYQESARSFNAANELTKQDTSAADKGLAETYQKVFNPTGVVRPGQMVMIEGAQGVLDEVAGKLKGWVDGESRLSPDLRARMIAAMQAQVQSDRQVAGQELLSGASDIVRLGGNPTSYMPKLEPLAQFQPAQINTQLPTAHGPTPGSGPGPAPAPTAGPANAPVTMAPPPAVGGGGGQPPVPGAQWDAGGNRWVVQQGGKWFEVKP